MVMMISTLRVQFLLLLGTSLWLASSSASNAEGVAFLAANQNKEGVVSLASGMQYKVLHQKSSGSGGGSYHPKASTPCSVHYTGSLIDGTVFDSSVERGQPTTFAPNQVVAGWTEAMQLMVEGDKWELYIPSDMAYGDRGSPPKIPGGAVLVFQMEMLEITGPDSGKVAALRCDAVGSSSSSNCNDKELAYLTKIVDWDIAKKEKEITRLVNVMGDSSQLKAHLSEWIQRRLHILRQLVVPKSNSKKEGEEAEL